MCDQIKIVPVLKHHVMKTYGEVEERLHVFTSLAVDGSGHLQVTNALSPGAINPIT
jgi:hypothetical protein